MDVCLSLLHVGFQEKQCFWLMGCDMSVIDKWHYYFYYTCIVWKSGECESQAWTMYVCMCGMWFTDDILLMILINMRWCWYLW